MEALAVVLATVILLTIVDRFKVRTAQRATDGHHASIARRRGAFDE